MLVFLDKRYSIDVALSDNEERQSSDLQWSDVALIGSIYLVRIQWLIEFARSDRSCCRCRNWSVQPNKHPFPTDHSILDSILDEFEP